MSWAKNSVVMPRLYPILDVATLQRRNLPISEFARGLVEGGAEIVQLRDKHGGPREVLARAAMLSEAIAGSRCRPVMNDRVDLAILAGWSAVHLGHKDLPVEAARRVFGDGALLAGVSTHNEEQVLAAEQGTADYIAVGPVFGTTTKTDAEPVIGLEGVRQARKHTRKPLVAIGGITRDNAASVMEAGADSVAVIGGLLIDGESVAAVVRDFLERLR